jgi:hypothetical protein
MAYRIFKVAEQDWYPDVPGKKYVYDNTHSVRVQKGDVFLYLDKRQGYSFSATGMVARLTKRKPTEKERSRVAKVKTVFTAHLDHVIAFTSPLSISPNSKIGNCMPMDSM